MTIQEIYSLAIQALHERRDWLMRAGRFPEAVSDCEEAIEYLQQHKSLDQVLSGCDCKFDIEIIDPDCREEL